LLKWLVDEHCCPLRSIRISSGKEKDSSGSYTPILTSKGRSLLGIGLENRNIGIVRYLVVEKRMLLSAEKELNLATVVQNLDLVLRALPEAVLNEQTFSGFVDDVPGSDVPSSRYHDSTEPRSFNARMGGDADDEDSETLNDAVSFNKKCDCCSDVRTVDLTLVNLYFLEKCIICFSNSIDCVATPCGHQICCLVCSRHIQRCPVCSMDCSFMRVFKP
jgi:Zinc finger, C3HC4 type (RING finger)